MLTYTERQTLLTQPFPVSTVYGGMVWAGVQVIDKFMRETAEDILLFGYDGLYSDLVAELETIVADTPFSDMAIEDL